MSNSSNVPLAVLRLQAQQRADMESNPFVQDYEWNSYLTLGAKELLDKLVACYSNDYRVATTWSFNTSNAQSYPLPDGTGAFTNDNGGVASKFYKLLGVDLQYSASPSGWISLRNFEFIERNKWAYPNVAVNWNGYSNLRYRLEGDNLFLVPVPMTGQAVRIWYVPAPTSLQFNLVASATILSNVFSLQDTTDITPGMNALVTPTQQNLIVTSVSSNSVTVNGSITFQCFNTPVSFYNDAASFDGIAGWEEYVILYAAIKAKTKQEDPIDSLAAQLLSISQRIDSMAESRDVGQAFHTSDVLGIQGYGGMGGDSGWGMGGSDW